VHLSEKRIPPPSSPTERCASRWGRLSLRRQPVPPLHVYHSEMPANLLIVWRSNFHDFSECALINKENHLDFDSAIPRFESWRPIHQPLPELPTGCADPTARPSLFSNPGATRIFILTFV